MPFFASVFKMQLLLRNVYILSTYTYMYICVYIYIWKNNAMEEFQYVLLRYVLVFVIKAVTPFIIVICTYSGIKAVIECRSW